MTPDLKRTPLFDLHVAQGAKMVPFAGYEMPVQYPLGVMKEHMHTRGKAGLFDVSHMGQITVRAASGTYQDTARALETLIPQDALGLAEGRQRYGFFTNDKGGIKDDFMFANRGDHVLLVVNAACKDNDLAHLQAQLTDCTVELDASRALLALQGPKAADVMGLDEMSFMEVREVDLKGTSCLVSRSGYTGEDGFEISMPSHEAAGFASALLEHDDVEFIGLGARDSLRLEAGLCLYGQDIAENISPVEASLNWAIQKTRRRGGERGGGFPGADRILEELETGAARTRVGVLPAGKAPLRQCTQLFAQEEDNVPVGSVTSGGFGPAVARPVSMALIASHLSEPGTQLFADLRGKRTRAYVSPLPFIPPNYKR